MLSFPVSLVAAGFPAGLIKLAWLTSVVVDFISVPRCVSRGKTELEVGPQQFS